MKIMKRQKESEKKGASKESGNQITYIFFIIELQVCSSSLRCAFCYLRKTKKF